MCILQPLPPLFFHCPDLKLLGGMQNMLKYMSTSGRSMKLLNALEIWISN